MGEKLLLFGALPVAYLTEWEITQDLELAEEKLSVSFAAVPVEDLFVEQDSLGDVDAALAKRLARKLGAEAADDPDAVELSRAQLEKATRLYVAMENIRDREGADGVSTVCRAIKGEERATPCIALTLFQERGIPAACQGDIDAWLTMVLFKRLTGWISFMGGAHVMGDDVAISHCVLCRAMRGPEAPEQPYYVSDYHGRDPGPTLGTELPSGETVTIARLTRDLESLLLTSGTVTGCGHGDGLCRNRLLIDVPDRQRLLEAVKGHQNHYVVACGDHVSAMRALAVELEIPVVDLGTEDH